MIDADRMVVKLELPRYEFPSQSLRGGQALVIWLMPDGSKRTFPAALHIIHQPLIGASRVLDVPNPDRFFEFDFAFVDHFAEARP